MGLRAGGEQDVHTLFTRPDFAGSRTWVFTRGGARGAGLIRREGDLLLIQLHQVDGWFADGDTVHVEIGMADGLYSFSTRVARFSGRTLRIYPPAPGEIARRQDRAFVRVPVSMEATLHHEAHRTPIPVRLLDLSGGGARVFAPVYLSLGDRVELELELQGTRMRLTGRVVRPSDRERQAGIVFEGLTRAQENRLVAFTFWRQSQLLRQQR